MAHWFQLDAVQTTVLLAFSALPTASTCYVLAARMGYNGPRMWPGSSRCHRAGVASLLFFGLFAMKSTIDRRALLGAWLVHAGSGRRAAGCSRKPATQPVPAGATVLALGDSLTSGVGASADTAYPPCWQPAPAGVINAGVSGNTSAQALERLPALLQEHRPALVIVSIGGNDFAAPAARNHAHQPSPHWRTGAVPAARRCCWWPCPAVAHGRCGPPERPRGVRRDSQGAEDSAACRWLVHRAGRRRLRADSVHANAAGYARFTDGLAQTLQSTGLLSKT